MANIMLVQNRLLCNSCRALAEDLAGLEGYGDAFRLNIGLYARKFGHEQAHKVIREKWHTVFSVPSLDSFIAGAMTA